MIRLKSFGPANDHQNAFKMSVEKIYAKAYMV